jgi:DNA mismatch repair ATPase MutS
LLARADIQATVQRLIAQRERATQASALSDKTRVLSRLREWMDGSDSTSNQLRAAELLGKSVGLFKDVVETTDSRSSEELLAELDAMLEQAEPEAEPDQPESGQLH